MFKGFHIFTLNVNSSARHGGPHFTTTTSFVETDRVLFCRIYIYTAWVSQVSPHHHLLFIAIPLSVTRFMNTRKKNRSAHPGIPDMTPSQLRSAGVSHTPKPRRPSTRKPTKDQQIAALQDELRAAQELIQNVSHYLVFCTLRLS